MSATTVSPPQPSSARANAGLAPLLIAVPPIMAISPATIGVVVSLYALVWCGSAPRDIPWRSPPALFVVAVALFGVLSALWAVDSSLAIEKALKFAVVCLPLAWLSVQIGQRHECRSLARPLLIGCALAAMLLAVQTFGGVVLRSYVSGDLDVPAAIKTNVPAAALAILAWAIPALWATLNGPWRALAGGILLLIGTSVFAGDGTAPRLAFIVGGAALLLAWRLPRLCTVLLVTALVITHIAAPRLLQTSLSQSITDRSLLHRMEVWALAGELIDARPLLGYGFSNSGAIPAQQGALPLTGERRVIPMYPHNVLLQAQLELGVAGVIFFYGALGYLLWRLQAIAGLPQAAGLALIAAALGIWCVGYPLWRSTWVAWLWFTAIAWQVASAPEARACPGS